MKRKGFILTEETVTKDLCVYAIERAARNKHHRKSVKDILNDIDAKSIELRDMILNDTFVPTEYGHSMKMDCGKLRHLSKPKFYPDQCVHHVVFLLAEKIYLNHIDPHSISSIKNRGVYFGIHLIKKWINVTNKKNVGEAKYALQFDIKKCFDSVQPKYVMKELRTIFKDERYLHLIEKILFVQNSLPLGNYLSSWFLNILLRRVDSEARQDKNCTHYLRYMDDILILGNSKKALRNLFHRIKTILSKIELRIKENWQIYRVLGTVTIDRKTGKYFHTNKKTREFDINHPNHSFRIAVDANDLYRKIFTVRPIDILGVKISNTGIGWRKKNLRKLKRECLAFNKHRHFTHKRAMGLLSLISFMHYFSSAKVWEFVTSHINISHIKYIAYGRSYAANAYRKRKHKDPYAHYKEDKYEYFKIKIVDDGEDRVFDHELFYGTKEDKDKVLKLLDLYPDDFDIEVAGKRKYNKKKARIKYHQYLDKVERSILYRENQKGSSLNERLEFYDKKRERFLKKVKARNNKKKTLVCTSIEEAFHTKDVCAHFTIKDEEEKVVSDEKITYIVNFKV